MKNNVLPLDLQPGLFDGDETDDRFESAGPNRHRFITVLWMALFNLAAVALVAVAFVHGWAQLVFSSDVTGLTYVIAGVFLFGLALSFAKAWKIACEADCVSARNPCAGTWANNYIESITRRSAGSRAIAASTLRFQVASRISPVHHVASSLVLLGLIGTVLGFIIALAGVSAESATSLSDTSLMVSRLIAGMSVALYTTLEGAVLNLWLIANYRIISTAAARLVNELVALGENSERSRSGH
jgi:hypothetical protein